MDKQPTPPAPEKVDGDSFPLPKKRRLKKVLRRFITGPIFALLITITPKPFNHMLTWLKERFSEPSTYQGLTVLASAVGYTINPEFLDAIAAIALSVIGLIQVLKKEGKVVEKTQE